MKIGAGGLQAYVTHDDVASRQAQENRKPAEPVRPQDSENTATLNKDALNKTVEKLNDAAQAFDLPLRFAHKKPMQVPTILKCAIQKLIGQKISTLKKLVN